MISGQTKLAGLFADPASHSLSPLMHNTAFEANNIDAVYLAFKVNPMNLKQAVESIRTFDMLGVNLSMPNKTAVIPYLDEVSQEAQLIGAVNTIVHEKGRLIGYNTDGAGFMQSVQEAGISVKKKKVTLLGAGGAAKAVTVQAALDGAKEIVVYKRNNQTFAQVKETFEQLSYRTSCKIKVRDFADTHQLRKDLKESCLLVNATDIGMGKKINQSPLLDISMMHEDLAVFDLIYAPRETRLLKEAKKVGAKGYNGLGMLIYQGAIAFELWTKEKMPIHVIEKLFD